MTPTFSLILPCVDENENLLILIPRIIDGFRGDSIEIVIVDDGSTDGSIETLERFQSEFPFITLVRRQRRMGLGSALKTGFDTAVGRFLLSFDCDLPVPLEDIARLARTLRSGQFDLVLGSRHLPGSFYEAPSIRIRGKRALSRFGSMCLRAATGIRITDFTFNCRGMARATWPRIRPESNDNFMLCEMVLRAMREGCAVGEVPVRYFDRKLGASKLSLESEVARYVWQFWAFQWRLRRGSQEARRDRR